MITYMVTLIAEIIGGFFALWIIFYLLFARKSKEESPRQSVVSLPTPRADNHRLESISADLLALGFTFLNNYDKMNYGLWPAPVKLYAHRDVQALAELAILPTEEPQVQFISFFPVGALMTTAGERQVTLRFMTTREMEYWETGGLPMVWNMHIEHMEEYETENTRYPLPATEERYIDLLNAGRETVYNLLNGESLVPRTLNDYLLMGYLFLNQKRTMEALEMFQGAINLDADKPFLHRMAGRISMFVGDFEAAGQYFYEAIDLDSQDKDSYVLLADALLRQEKRKVALEILRKGHNLIPGDPEISLQFGILATEFGELEAARRNLEPLDGVIPPSYALFRALADLHTKLGDAKKAKGYARMARVFAHQKRGKKEGA